MFVCDSPKIKRPIVLTRPKTASPFRKSKSIQLSYERSLRGISKEVGKLIKAFDPGRPSEVEKVKRSLSTYADLIEPWAFWVVRRLLYDLNRQDQKSWKKMTANFTEALQKEVEDTPIGSTISQLMLENVTLIKSIPLQAGQRVHDLVQKNLFKGQRAGWLANEILKTESVTRSRATLIARTEVARATSTLTEARSLHIGAETYIWRTSEDGTVRISHREMNGREFRWDSPPTLSDGTTTHPGMIYNCRCYPEPVVPEGAVIYSIGGKKKGDKIIITPDLVNASGF